MNLTPQQKLEILCAYLPHGVEVDTPDGILKLKGIDTASDLHQIGLMFFNGGICIKFWYIDCKPILRHPDDMTEEELIQLGKFLWNDQGLNNNISRENAQNWLKGYLKVSLSPQWAVNCINYLHSRHIDTFGAIEAGWAIRKQTN